MKRLSLLALLALLSSAAHSSADPEITFPLHDPCNLFTVGDPVHLDVRFKNLTTPSPLTLSASVSDFAGHSVWQGKQQVTLDQGRATVGFDIGPLNAGYYEMKVHFDGAPGDAKVSTATESFGVVIFNDRTTEQVRSGDYRFGLKLGGGPKNFDYMKAMTASARLGLHWTRQLFDQVTPQMADLPINMVYKIEGMPDDAYDAAKYGPQNDFKFRHFGWKKATIPLEEPYKKWLAEQIAKLPKSAHVFEIWNEPWGKVNPSDFAKVAQWSKDVILAAHPDARVGPNLGTFLSYDATFIAAGGMTGMNSLFLHPYGHPERSSLRSMVHGRHAFYQQQLGRDIDFYATEFGSPTPPAGARSDVTEALQAAWNVRRSLTFYAEDFKGFMPHIMAETEADPAEKEDWYGHFRKNMQPKPALIALATAARLIDGTTYVGDLFLKPDVGAMLFQRSGQYTLALWTNDQTIPLTMTTGTDQVTQIDLMGKETHVPTPGGKLALNLTGNMIYLQGVNPDLAQKASKQPRSDQWVQGLSIRKTRVAHYLAMPPTIDGRIDPSEWRGQTTIDLSRSNTPAADASAIGYVAWDKNYLYVAADVKDDHPNGRLPADQKVVDWRKSFRNASSYRPIDSIDVFVGSQPQYQVLDYLYDYDTQMFFSPLLDQGKPIAGSLNAFKDTFTPIPGLKMATAQNAHGWSIELAIPLTQFKEFPTQIDSIIAFEMRLNDADPNKSSMTLINPVDADPKMWDSATLWSLLKLER